MRRKQNKTVFKITQSAVKAVFVVFWKKCCMCKDEIALEYMFTTNKNVRKLLVRKHSGAITTKRSYLCTSCAENRTQAITVFNNIRKSNNGVPKLPPKRP